MRGRVREAKLPRFDYPRIRTIEMGQKRDKDGRAGRVHLNAYSARTTYNTYVSTNNNNRIEKKLTRKTSSLEPLCRRRNGGERQGRAVKRST